MKKILNIGVQPQYDKSLIRKIRISNLVALISFLVMFSYIPLSLFFDQMLGLVLILFFAGASLINFIFHYYKQHQLAFVFFTFAGFIYFFFATILFGLNSNIHYYFLVMCMICSVIFDAKWVINLFISIAILCFFSLLFIMKDKNGLIIDSPELIEVQTVVGYVVALLLFIIACIFFIFLKTENHNYQKEILAQKEIIEEKHKEITDSINYAERIQRSFLATKELLDENLKEYFVFFQPKDVVSGDFYWAAFAEASEANGNRDLFYLATADSTGHGVPGAIMSILNISSLELAIKEKLYDPAEIFNYTRTEIINRLKKDGSAEGGKDGMDASLICFDFSTKKLTYAAANNPIWIVRENEIIEFSPDKMPVGKHDKQHIPFTSHEVDLKEGDIVYTLTDGLPDQFGGGKGKKFMYKKLKELLISIANDPMDMQKEKLTKAFFDWKGDLEQVDDLCVIGVKI